ncbi:MAG: hypothetical protein Q8K57_03815 [Thiobacillus sp.]|nr:hypothetical protein [Thiobacillus sp.]MDP3124052.1 hypothetical protein [Thiobacillus sp.]
MALDNSLVKKITYTLAVLGGIAAGVNSFQNAQRAGSGCGEYSTRFVYSDAFSEALMFCIPVIILLFIVKVCWQPITFRVASLLTTAIFFVSASYFLILDTLVRYAPCDMKGDEHSVVLLLLGTIGIMFLWPLLMFGLEVLKLLFQAYQRISTNKNNELPKNV